MNGGRPYLSYDLIEDVVLQDDLVGVGEKLVTYYKKIENFK